MQIELPQSVKATLWSYDTARLAVEKDKERIITNVLNFGTYEANKWLFATYPRDTIKEVVQHPRPGEWDKKSLNYWGIVFDITPKMATRF